MPENPILSPIWNSFVVSVLRGGPDSKVSKEVLGVYSKMLKTSFINELTVSEMYNAISNILKTRYNNGICNKCMI
jgi:hypothetical protein